MERLGNDIRHAVRRLVRTPGFTLVALLTLALGIGANTALFSVVHAVLLQPLPFEDPDNLYWVWSRHTSTDRYPFQLPEFCDYRDQNRTLRTLAGFANWNANLNGDGPAERLTGLRVSGSFFPMLGAPLAIGRALRVEDDSPGHEKVVVLAHGLWQRRFGGDPHLVGRSLSLNGEPYTVVGVLGPGFLFPVRNVDFAIPLAPDRDPWRQNRQSTSFLRAIARARDGASRAQIEADLGGIAQRLQKEFPDSYARKKGVMAIPYREETTRTFRPALLVLLSAVLLLLLIACANLANLMLIRANERRGETAVRRALGASHGHLAGPLLAESLMLSLGGAALGILLARIAVPALVALCPASMPRAGDIEVNLPVLGFTMAAAVLSALVFGLVPALRATKADPSRELQADGRGATGSGDRGAARGLVVMAQVAVMMVLLVGAGLLLQSFQAVMRVEPGFEEDVLTARLSLPRADYADIHRVSRFYRNLEGRLTRLAGVTEVAAVNHVPLNGALASADYKVADRAPISEDQLPTAQYRMVTPAYFRAMGIPLRAGRAFDDDDREGGALVAIVTESLARQSFPDRSPVGEHLLVKDNPEGFRTMEIVGVVGDLRHSSLEGEPEPHLFVPYHQTHRELLVWLALNQFVVVRTSGAPSSVAEGLRRELRALDPNVAAADLRTTGFYVEAAAAARRFSLVLLTLFAGVGLVMAGVGIFGVVSYSVAQRRRETGVRLALGATMRDIVVLILGEGLRRTFLGVLTGLLAALLASRALRSQIYGVEATDPLTYAGAIVLLVGVTLAACLLPAWRAARSNPLETLRRG